MHADPWRTPPAVRGAMYATVAPVDFDNLVNI